MLFSEFQKVGAIFVTRKGRLKVIMANAIEQNNRMLKLNPLVSSRAA